MEIAVRLSDLSAMHPRLLWGDIAGAAAVVLRRSGVGPVHLELTMQDLPDFEGDKLRLVIDPAMPRQDDLDRLGRTYESSRLVELAAIAIAGLGLYHGGGHEIRDVALRGSGADYLVDDSDVLEVAGRSRKTDFEAAWETRWQRLAERPRGGFYVCVVEFETPAGRIAFQGPGGDHVHH